MRQYLVVEGPTDKSILSAVLAPELKSNGTMLIDAGGQTGSISAARTLLATRQSPVGLVIDSDTTDPLRCEEQFDFANESLRSASGGAKWSVFLAVPELEICLFADVAALQKMLGISISADETIRAGFEPKNVLIKALAAERRKYEPDELGRLLAAHDLTPIRNHPLIKKIRQFVAPPEELTGRRRRAITLDE